MNGAGWALLLCLAGCVQEPGLVCQPSISADVSRETGISGIHFQEQCAL